MEDTRDTEALGLQKPQVAQMTTVAACPSCSVWSDAGEILGGWWARMLGKGKAEIREMWKILNWRGINYY